MDNHDEIMTELKAIRSLLENVSTTINVFAGRESSILPELERTTNAVAGLHEEQTQIRSMLSQVMGELKPTIDGLMSGPLGMLLGKG